MRVMTAVVLASALAGPAARAQQPEAPPSDSGAAPPIERWPAPPPPVVVQPAPEARTFAVDRNATLRFTLAAVGRSSYLRDGGYRLFSREDTSDANGALVGYDVLASARGALGLGAGFLTESLNGRGADGGSRAITSAATAASLDVTTVFAEARVRWALLSWLQPHARLTGGATRGAMSVTTTGGSRLTGTTWAPSGSVGAGLTFRSPPIRLLSIDGHPAFALSLALEGGYAFGGALELELFAQRNVPPGGSAQDLIPSQPVKAGDLGRNFPYAGGTLALHF